ncbi:hypothetical protein EV361DRAFT_958393 [Lentinula raphanica]|uniref:Uncharacterized protein n=1 Tax=Lentinula raphanica TaxID=153919 RepID=A0AA38PIA8_9AGAR|nr:hypothetical protein C8R42DRAFT_603586 [Lentinula raphanica]KAJ3843438.1 hypothetical protein F5878DRAFT_656741 [Lentinula raphanica]KAJ3976832.1 hypothetical protein EV361DRAFT_958393 [Lentinula raphanica]
MAAIYAVYTHPTDPPIPNHLPTLIVTPHGQPENILYSYLHTNFNSENYLLTPSPKGDLCVAKLYPPPPKEVGKRSVSEPGHSSPAGSRVARCEASRNLKWTIANTGVISPIYKLSLPSPDSPDLPLFQISKPNPNAAFWSMFYFAYAGHNIPPKRIEFGKIQKNPNGGGTRISITGKTPEEKAVWQTLGEGNEDCVEWVVLCAALNLLDDEIMKAAEKSPGGMGGPAPVSLQDSGPVPNGPIPPRSGSSPMPPGVNGPMPPRGIGTPGPDAQRPVMPPHSNSLPPGGRPGPPMGQGYPPNQPPRGPYPPGQGPPPGPPGPGAAGFGPGGPMLPQGYGPGPGRGGPPPQMQMRGGMPPPGPGYRGPPPPQGGMPMQGHPLPSQGGMPMQGHPPPPQQIPPQQAASRRF